MEGTGQIGQLEQALLQQAESLAREHLKNAESARARIREEAETRLRLREEREILAAKEEAERRVRQRVQAAQTRLAAELDRQRWALTQAARAGVEEALRELVADPPRYLEVLADWLRAAAAQLPAGDLVVEVNPADLALLSPRWDAFATAAAPGRRAVLAAGEAGSPGGLRVRLADDSARLDQTFEGRRERLAEDLARVVMERLFASAPDLGSLIHG
jgi:V/A-type H+-transporting ATPase subunit E